jgi:predicted dehydrogenase
MRFGIVGLGWSAQAFHVPSLRIIGGAEIVGGCDASDEQRAIFTKATGIPAYASLDELFERGRPEVVVVATPPDSHRDLCVAALASGAHVICEKPFVETVAQADDVIAAADRAGRFVAVNHQYREKPVFRAVYDRVGQPDVGEIVFCQVSQLMDVAPWDEPVAWRRAMPNRTLFEAGVHLIDLLLMLYGEPPVAVYARTSAGLDAERKADAIHLVMLEFSRGRLAQITIDRLCKAGTRYIDLRVDCEHASLRASHGGRALLELGMKRAGRPGIRVIYGRGGVAWEERGFSKKSLARNPGDPAVAATKELFRKIATALEEGREPPSSASVARQGLQVVEAAYASAASGERVVLEPQPTEAATVAS